MEPKERMDVAMSLGTPDRVPVMCQMSIGHMLLQTGLPPEEFWFSAEVFAEGLCRLRKTYGFDGILVSLYGHSRDTMKHAASLTRKDSDVVILWKNGDKTVFPPDDLPRHYPREKKPLPLVSEFDPDRIPEDLRIIPVSQGLEFRIHPGNKYEVFSFVKERVGDAISIHGEVTSPFDYLLHMFGFEQALIALREEPARCLAMLERLAHGVRKIAVEQCLLPVDAIKISSPFAGAGFISPDDYRRFVLPFESQIAQAVREKGIHVYTHTCGRISDRLELMVSAGISGLECLDPPPIGDVSLEDAKKRVGHEVFIKGNVNPVGVLLYGNPESVFKDARFRLRVGMPGGGYILSSACSVAPRTPPENILALVRAAEELGRY
ncbi:MAG: uroporphyrinogen decarboxylase family protein [Candidatus Aminicenantales bacterium]